jgi:uncharacterized membrane protein YfcA
MDRARLLVSAAGVLVLLYAANELAARMGVAAGWGNLAYMVLVYVGYVTYFLARVEKRKVDYRLLLPLLVAGVLLGLAPFLLGLSAPTSGLVRFILPLFGLFLATTAAYDYLEKCVRRRSRTGRSTT